MDAFSTYHLHVVETDGLPELVVPLNFTSGNSCICVQSYGSGQHDVILELLQSGT